MNCAELEALLCEYVDGTLGAAARAEVERHLAACAVCAETARDAAAAVAFIERVTPVEPPPHLITRVLFELNSLRGAPLQRRAGVTAALRRWFHPVLQPRFAMGMAMTILSFSMLGRFAGISVRQLKPSDLDPVKVWEEVDNRIHRAWVQAVKLYDSLRVVYEVRSRLREIAEEEETTPAAERSAPGAAARDKAPERSREQERKGP